jgi:hypothetical protein
MKIKLFLFSALLLLSSNISALIINVPGSQPTIQAGINASANGDTVLVEPGTYFENINFRGKNIVVTSRYYLTLDPYTVTSTVINGSTPLNPDTASCVIITSGEDSTTVLQGFSITGGTGTKWQDEHGAGRYREGGGILVQYSSPVIRDNIILNNQVIDVNGVISTGGGGVRIGDSYVRFYNNIVMNNTARYGAGVVLNYTGGEYYNNVICSNYGSYQYGAGSGIWINSTFSRPTVIINNTIAGNTSTTAYCGIYGSNNASIRNCIVWGNYSPSNQYVSTNLNVRYSNVQGGVNGAGNINTDPLFSDSNYVLGDSSPCIDAGDSSTIYNDIEDSGNPGMALFPSKGTVRSDMGAYGGPLAKLLTNILIGINSSGTEIPQGFALHQNYPNPFNPQTTISFDLPNTGYTRLIIYDLNGKEVKTLVNQQLSAGKYHIDFNADGISSGVYFYRLVSSGLGITKKMIVVK